MEYAIGSCLASRLAYGEKITGEKLNMVYEAEKYIRSLGFGTVQSKITVGHCKNRIITG